MKFGKRIKAYKCSRAINGEVLIALIGKVKNPPVHSISVAVILIHFAKDRVIENSNIPQITQ